MAIPNIWWWTIMTIIMTTHWLHHNCWLMVFWSNYENNKKYFVTGFYFWNPHYYWIRNNYYRWVSSSRHSICWTFCLLLSWQASLMFDIYIWRLVPTKLIPSLDRLSYCRQQRKHIGNNYVSPTSLDDEHVATYQNIFRKQLRDQSLVSQFLNQPTWFVFALR